MLLADRHAVVEGVGGVVRDGIVEGWFGYEAGQPAVGDIFGWFAKLVGAGDFAALERGAAECPPGGRGLLALDWWNGNRSVLVDANLSGLIVGLTLSTTAPEIYRALVEATAFSTRRILEAFEAKQIPVEELIAVGGLAERSPLLLQIYADVTRRPIGLADTANASALGAAMLGAVAAGAERGGHASFVDAARAMARRRGARIEPSPAAAAAYDASTATGSNSTTTSAAAAPTSWRDCGEGAGDGPLRAPHPALSPLGRGTGRAQVLTHSLSRRERDRVRGAP